MDKAFLNVSNIDSSYFLDLWAQSKECYLCSPWKYLSLKPYEESELIVNTTYPTNLYVTFSNSSKYLHSYKFHFAQKGVYSLNFNSTHFFPIITHHEGNNEYRAIFAAFLYLQFLYGSSLAAEILQKWIEEGRSFSFRRNQTNESADLSALVREGRDEDTDEINDINPPQNAVPRSISRLSSLDTFRGITIALMIFVNYGGGGFYFFKHSPWNGLTIADLIFPWFMWIMGVSLVFSIKSMLSRMTPMHLMIAKICKRSTILFALGIILNSARSNYLPELRILGVLQRFAFCYFISALLEMLFLKIDEPLEEVKKKVLCLYLFLLKYGPKIRIPFPSK